MQNLQALKDSSKSFKKKYPKDIHDIILFGSTVKGKIKPGDIDVCILSYSRTPAIERIVVEFGEKVGSNIHVTSLPFSKFPRNSLFKTIIHEGISLLTGKTINESLGFSSQILFWYDLSGLSQTEKVKFFYALKGRQKQTGILRKVGAQYLGKGVLLVPVESDNEMIEFLTQWRIRFNRRRILLER